MAAPTITVSLSRNGTDWTDISDYTVLNGRWNRGRSQALGEWVPGTATLRVLGRGRVIDPLNDDATYRPRIGDHVKIETDGGEFRWRGWVDDVRYQPVQLADGSLIFDTSLVCTDGLARLQRKFVSSTALGDDDQALSSAHITATYTQVGYTDNRSTATGVVYCSNAGRNGAGNALSYIQDITRTEGGASRLYSSKAGTLTWKARSYRSSTVVEFGDTADGRAPFSAPVFAEAGLDWANYLTVTPAAHTDTFSSSSSVAIGTGSKTFTVVLAVAPCTAGATVVATATAGATGTMTGTVTSCSTTSLVINVTSVTGSGTGTAWSIATTEPATGQTVFDEQSYDSFGQWRNRSMSTLHANRSLAANAAALECARRSFPPRRLTAFTVLVHALSSGDQSDVFGLEIGDVADVHLDLGSGDPSTLRQVRVIDGVDESVTEAGEYRLTFTLGMVATMNFTCVLKQNGTVASTTDEAVYTVDDAGWCTAHFSVAATAAGTAGHDISIETSGLPAPASATAGAAVGILHMIEFGAPNRVGVVNLSTAGVLKFVSDLGTDELGTNPSTALASGDYLNGTIKYRVAA